MGLESPGSKPPRAIRSAVPKHFNFNFNFNIVVVIVKYGCCGC
jgi:hypothetical protein